MAKSKLVTMQPKSGDVMVFTDTDGDVKVTRGDEFNYDFALYFTPDEALALAQELTAAAFKAMKPKKAEPAPVAVEPVAALAGAEEF